MDNNLQEGLMNPNNEIELNNQYFVGILLYKQKESMFKNLNIIYNIMCKDNNKGYSYLLWMDKSLWI